MGSPTLMLLALKSWTELETVTTRLPWTMDRFVPHSTPQERRSPVRRSDLNTLDPQGPELTLLVVMASGPPNLQKARYIRLCFLFCNLAYGVRETLVWPHAVPLKVRGRSL